jgi:hypothetical protein
LELRFSPGKVDYRWRVDEPNFVMPVRVGNPASWQLIKPTSQWQSMNTSVSKEQFAVATDLYFIDVEKQ